MKIATKDRYVVENGIPMIRQLHPHSKKPMPTEREKDIAVAKYTAARAAIDAGHFDEKGAVVEFEIDLSQTRTLDT